MADNVTADAGSGGAVLAADDISSVFYPRGKLSLGPDGTANDALAGAGAVGVGVQRVTLASDDPAVVDLAAIEVLNTTIAGDTTSIDGKITACNTGAVVLAAGTAAIGKLTANSGVDIGDVDITSVVPGTAATNLGKAEDAAHSTGDVGIQSLAVRTDTPANRSGTDGDYEPIQMSAGRVWTSSTIDTALPAGTNAIGKLSANSGVDIGDVDVTSCALPTGASTSAGQLADGHNVTIDNSTGAAAVNIQDGGNSITVDNGGTFATQATLQAGTAEIGKLAAGVAAIGSITNGALIGPADPSIDSYANIAINLAAAANQVLVSSAADKQIWVYGVGFTVNTAATTVSFQDEDDVAITGIMQFAQYGGLNSPPAGNFSMPMWKLATNKDLEVDVVTGELDGWLAYAIVSV